MANHKIEWNKVTWYSKFIALVLFIVLPFIGFWLGIKFEEGMASANPVSVGQTDGSGSTTNSYYENTAQWQTDKRPDGGFSLAYPLDFTTNDIYAITPVTDWRLGANGNPGAKMLTISIPRAFEPQTNFADATLTVGKSSNNVAIADCMTPDQGGGPGSGFATTTINGIQFSVFKSAGAGAGNFYDTTSYRTKHAGACYAIEYTVHSSQIANYPSQYGLKPFDEGKVTQVLDRIVGTFMFQ